MSGVQSRGNRLARPTSASRSQPDVSQGLDIALGRIAEVHSEVSGPVECATKNFIAHFIARSRNFAALSRNFIAYFIARRSFIAHFIARPLALAISPITQCPVGILARPAVGARWEVPKVPTRLDRRRHYFNATSMARPIPTPPIPTDRRPPPPPGRPPPTPGLHETRPLTTLEFINAGRKARNEPLLTERDIVAGPEQPKAQKADPVKTADLIVRAGEAAGAGVPTPMPSDPVAAAIIRAGRIARNERPDD